MPYIDPLPRAASPEFEDVFQAMENALGYVPNSFSQWRVTPLF